MYTEHVHGTVHRVIEYDFCTLGMAEWQNVVWRNGRMWYGCTCSPGQIVPELPLQLQGVLVSPGQLLVQSCVARGRRTELLELS